VKQNIFIVILLFLLSVKFATSQTEFYPANTFDLKLFGGKSSGTSFFDLNGEIKFQLPVQFQNEEQPERNYIFEYSSYQAGIKVEYALYDNWVLFSEIPIVYHSLLQKADTTVYVLTDSASMIYDTISYKREIGDFTLFQPSYYSLGGRYKFYSKLAYMAASAELRIPPGFHDGIQNDPDYEFLSDGALEFHTGIILGIKFEKG